MTLFLSPWVAISAGAATVLLVAALWAALNIRQTETFGQRVRRANKARMARSPGTQGARPPVRLRPGAPVDAAPPGETP